MINNILFSALLTFTVYFIVNFSKSIYQFMIFKRVRESILLSAYQYLKQTPEHGVDLGKLKEIEMKQLSELKIIRWVKDLKISWRTEDSIEFVFVLKFNGLSPKYKFVIGLKEMNELINSTR